MNLDTANTIKYQIGKQALVMLGAYNLIASDTGLAFRIRGSKKINHITIILRETDLYDIYFTQIGKNYLAKFKGMERGLYFDQLHKAIEKHTGLYTKLF